MVVDGRALAKRAEAEARLRLSLLGVLRDPSRPDRHPVEIGILGGFALTATPFRSMRDTPDMALELVGVPQSEVILHGEQQIAQAQIVTRLENRLTGLEHLVADTEAKIERRQGEVARAEGLVGKPFSQADQLAAARARLGLIDAELRDIAERQEEGSRAAAFPVAAEPVANADVVAADMRQRREDWARASAAASPVPKAAVRPPGARTP